MKTFRKLSSVFVFILVLLLGACTEESKNTSTSGGNDIVGSWIYEEEEYVFRKDGSGTYTANNFSEDFEYDYDSSSDEIQIRMSEDTFIIEVVSISSTTLKIVSYRDSEDGVYQVWKKGQDTDDDDDEPNVSGDDSDFLIGTWYWPGDGEEDWITFKANGNGIWISRYDNIEDEETFTYYYDADKEKIVLNFNGETEYIYVLGYTQNTLEIADEISGDYTERYVLYRDESYEQPDETLANMLIGSWIIDEGDGDYTYFTFNKNGFGNMVYYDIYGDATVEDFTYTVNESERTVYARFGDEVSAIKVLDITDNSANVSISENGGVPENIVMRRSDDADGPGSVDNNPFLGKWVYKGSALKTYLNFYKNGQGSIIDVGTPEEMFTYTYNPVTHTVSIAFQNGGQAKITLLEQYGASSILVRFEEEGSSDTGEEYLLELVE